MTIATIEWTEHTWNPIVAAPGIAVTEIGKAGWAVLRRRMARP